MSDNLDLAIQIGNNHFYVDPRNAGIVRGGFFDALGGMLIGQHAKYVVDALNTHAHARCRPEWMRGPYDEAYFRAMKVLDEEG